MLHYQLVSTSLGGATLSNKMNNTVHYRHVRHTLALICAKNHLLIFSSFPDIWENVEWPRFLDHPVEVASSNINFQRAPCYPGVIAMLKSLYNVIVNTKTRNPKVIWEEPCRHPSHRESYYLQRDVPSPSTISTPSTTPKPRPTPLTTPYGIQIQLAVLPQYTFRTRTDRQTHRPTDNLGDRSVRRALMLCYVDSERHAKNYYNYWRLICPLWLN